MLPARHAAPLQKGLLLALLLSLAACGGGGGGDSSSPADPGTTVPTPTPPSGLTPPSEADAQRFLSQATFGPTQANIDSLRTVGFKPWLASQFQAKGNLYSTGYSDAIHKAGLKDFCKQFSGFPNDYARNNCWREYYSAEPLSREFYRNALYGPDQLRQRAALALSQLFVVSNAEVEGTYGLREYQQMLADKAFGNFRDLLKSVTLSPVMGTYLNLVNNSKADPNENFARELLQLFSIGPCQLNADGTLPGGQCVATYDNNGVRDVAFALTGWTYPAGGVSPWGSSGWKNPTYLRGQMLAVAAEHDQTERKLPGGGTLAASRTPEQALDAVIDALYQHPNLPPFIGKQLIQHLVTSNPSPAYVARVSQAFVSGKAYDFGSGVRGDMQALFAAILLDPEARGDNKNSDPNYGRLREPAQYIAGMLRALNASSDGANFYWWWGNELGQIVFNANSVFNFYPPDYPLPGTDVVGPAFAIENANSTLARLNLATAMLYWGGLQAEDDRPGATGTQINGSNWLALADNPTLLVDSLDKVLVTGGLPANIKTGIVDAVGVWNEKNHGATWREERARSAVYLVLASPEYQVQR
ncbi:DUF1800 domain-containing protein [Chitinimonas taiwanensis]|uniref:Uncharacterized conserved protein, DUF1800 family n=1 Tax=Chitinimonas taiwanensis DSM 18899 TaxID=1121279 RepID=A0A1K2HHR3_9NEIS|nr:DUF1800 domain-containing protein [Chitinimonas taiwanensis]SFZ76392.1 Uncharacterized conserved protein, DUF1800 family [Chitinimonas taiwanensis DSM 18899]